MEIKYAQQYINLLAYSGAVGARLLMVQHNNQKHTKQAKHSSINTTDGAVR